MSTRRISPTVAALARQIESFDGEPGAATARFWAEIDRTGGTPLIEPGDDPDHRLLTFLWQAEATPDLHHVVVVGGPATWTPIDEDLMEHLPGSDVWSRTYHVRDDLTGRYWLSPNDVLIMDDDSPESEAFDWDQREVTFVADPRNHRRVHFPVQPSDPTSRAHDCSILPPLSGGDEPTSPDLGALPPLTEHRFTGPAGDERSVWVREPGSDAPVHTIVVLFDGWVWAHALPVPMPDGCLAVMIDALDHPARGRDLPCNPVFIDHVIDDIVPTIARRHHVDHGAELVLVGQSYGGLAAAFAAHHRPEAVAAAVCQSGSFWFERGTPFDEGSERLTAAYAERPRSDVRFSVAIGLNEGPEMLRVDRHFRDVLKARGDQLTYREYMGGHDWVCWQQLMPTMLADVVHPCSRPDDRRRP